MCEQWLNAGCFLRTRCPNGAIHPIHAKSKSHDLGAFPLFPIVNIFFGWAGPKTQEARVNGSKVISGNFRSASPVHFTSPHSKIWGVPVFACVKYFLFKLLFLFSRGQIRQYCHPTQPDLDIFSDRYGVRYPPLRPSQKKKKKGGITSSMGGQTALNYHLETICTDSGTPRRITSREISKRKIVTFWLHFTLLCNKK